MSDSNKSNGKTVMWEWIESFIIASILALFIRSFFIQPFKIPSGSMRMTLIEGDRLFVNKLKYGPLVPFTQKRIPGFSKANRADVIVFHKLDEKKDFIKRLIAFGGETVEIIGGDVYVDGQLVEHEVIKNIYYYNRGPYGQEGKSIQVPEGHYFVLGDNSGSSSDSRIWGFVPEETVVGKADFIFWPPKRIRMIR